MQNPDNQSNKQSRFVRTSLSVAIVIVMNLFFNYAVSFVYNEPTYDQFVKSPQVVEPITTKDECISVGGQWSESAPQVAPVKGETTPKGYCDQDYTNRKNYEDARKVYDRNVFITLVILGIISIVVGSFVAVSIIPTAFSWAGVLSLVIASMRYWGSADKLFKVIILACALGILIWLAVKKFSK
jgi:uncharacterized protein YqhQ